MIRPVRAGVAVLLVGCGPALDGPDPSALREQFDLRPLGDAPYPADNPYQAERVALGRLLFFDPILSGERDVSCATCHHPDLAFADGRPRAVGVGGSGLGPDRTPGVSAVTGDAVPEVARNAPTVLNAALAGDGSPEPTPDAPMFWDGRAVGLRGQALRPLVSRVEMRGDAFGTTDEQVVLDSIVARLGGIPEYVDRFAAAFAAEPTVTTSTLARAIAAYERELVSGRSPFDDFARGDDAALSAQQLRGLELFFTRAKCFLCHRGAMFSNYQFLVTAPPQEGPGASVLPGDDAGREEHTGSPDDRYRFRVPSLRNVELTGPYMHAGVFDTLDEVIRFYNDGAHPRHDGVSDEQIEVAVRERLELSDGDIADLVAFLTSLTDPGIEIDPDLRVVPPAVPSGLTPIVGVAAH